MESQNSSDNILLNRVSYKENLRIEEFIPWIERPDEDSFLYRDYKDGVIKWVPKDYFIDHGEKYVADNHGVHFDESRIGIGSKPLHNYKVDLRVPENTRMTGLHIGDGVFGFSLGNGTFDGFVPEIIGMGSTENDAGLYFVGKTSSSLPSNVPLIIMDARNPDGTPVKNRPIFAITNGDYYNYSFVIDPGGNVGVGRPSGIYKMDVEGTVRVKDVVTDTSVSLKSLKEEIEQLKKKVESLP